MVVRNAVLCFFLIYCQFFGLSQNQVNTNSHLIQLGYGFSNREITSFLEEAKGELNQDNNYLNPLESEYSQESNGLGPIYLRYHFRYQKHFSLGLILAYCDYTASSTHSYKRDINSGQGNQPFYETISKTSKNYTFGVRWDFHLLNENRIDPYIGIAGGYNLNYVRNQWETNDPAYSSSQPIISEGLEDPLYLAASLGIRFYPLQMIGIYAELCFDRWSYFQGGLVFKF